MSFKINTQMPTILVDMRRRHSRSIDAALKCGVKQGTISKWERFGAPASAIRPYAESISEELAVKIAEAQSVVDDLRRDLKIVVSIGLKGGES